MGESGQILDSNERMGEISLDDVDAGEQRMFRFSPRRFGALLLAGIALASSNFVIVDELETGSSIAKNATLSPNSIATSLSSEAPDPKSLAAQVASLISTVSRGWQQRQETNGDFIDPVEPGDVGGYGISMIGQGMVETGYSINDETLINDGLRAEVFEIDHPDNGGFEYFSLASSYMWNKEHLTTNGLWQEEGPKIAKFLETRGVPVVSAGAERCYSSTSCYENLKLVTAYSDILIRKSGLVKEPEDSSGTKGNSVDHILDQAAKNTGSDAYFAGSNMKITDSGILSDPTKDPLAYHDLSTMLLGHIKEALGGKTPHSIDQAFQRAARAIVGFMAPNGDTTFIGRGQGQVWTLGAEIDSLALAARYTSNTVWRGRYLAGVGIGLERLMTTYDPSSGVFPLVPRLEDNPKPDYLGVDNYANTVVYNGLNVYELLDAQRQLEATKPAPRETTAAQNNGVFVVPSHTLFATVRHGNLWWAIHAADTDNDARYDAGLVVAEKLVNGIWTPAVPYRPLTSNTTSPGPVLIAHGEHYVPIGNSISANEDGTVYVRGGWGLNPASSPKMDDGTTLTYAPNGDDGVKLEFTPKSNSLYEFQVWYEPGSNIIASSKGLEVTEPSGMTDSYTINLPVSVSHGGVYHSAYDKDLLSLILTVHAKSGKQVTYTTNF